LGPNQKSKIVNRYLPAAGRIEIPKKPSPWNFHWFILHSPIPPILPLSPKKNLLLIKNPLNFVAALHPNKQSKAPEL